MRSEVVGIVAGTPTKTGATNFMRLHLIGDRDETQGGKKRTKGKKWRREDRTLRRSTIERWDASAFFRTRLRTRSLPARWWSGLLRW